MERFYIRVFLLLGYLPATASEHYWSGFKVFHLAGVKLHFVWLLSADLPAYEQPSRRFLSPASTALQIVEAHKRFHRGSCFWNKEIMSVTNATNHSYDSIW